MTIATRGQGVVVDPPDGQTNTQSLQQPQQIVQPVNGGSIQLSETGILAADPSSDQQQMNNELMGEDNSEVTEPDFPHAKLALLDEKISSPRWVVPVLPEQELEVLLQASIDLCRKGLDVHSEACQRFFREGLTVSFTKILTDDAVNSWKFNIHHCIYQNCERLVELCVVKLSQDWFPLLDLLAMVFNPNNKFHTFNGTRPSETVSPGSNIPDEDLYAQLPPDTRTPRGWLVDLINRFGNLGGFQILLERFQSGKNLTVSVIYALIRPFGLCYEFLTVHTIVKYLMPIVEMVPVILDGLTDDELKKEAKNESKNDAISAIIKAAKCLVARVPNEEEMVKSLEIFRLKMILRLLQISSFNGKMNALNEVNKVIASVTYYPHRHTGLEEEEWLTAERMAKWIKENRVLQIVLRDSLHQPQYVEKLEKILRFIIKERALTLEDLDNVWAAQAGKHEAIVKNVHDLLAKLAWDFSPEQLDHLFECFQASWTNANKKQREKLLELIRRLAEDDKDGVMAHKVLTLFWNLAHSDDVPTEIMDQALTAHVKILDYSCSQERDAQKTVWLDNCVEELKSGDKWALPALKQIREICCLYEPSPNMNHSQRSHHIYYRQEVIERLQNQHSLVILVTNSLTSYMDKVRQIAKENNGLDPNNFFPDNRYNHIQQVQERLNFLRFLLKDGQLWLCADQAKEIWQCLAEEAVFPSDREACFKWFSKLMGEEPDLDPAINKDFFENNILQLDPTLLTESGMKCFERFFKAVNSKEGKLKAKRRAFLMDDVDLIGTEYIWRVVTNSGDDIANRAIELLKEVNTNLGPRLQSSLLEFHETYISECLDRLRAHYDTVSALCHEDDGIKDDGGLIGLPVTLNKLKGEAVKMCRVMKVLQEYIGECDGDFTVERKILPLHRACRGKHLALLVRFSNTGRAVDDVDIFTHSNDTLASLRRQILRRIKASGANVKLDLFINGELLDAVDDRKQLSQIPLRDKMLLSAKLCQVNSNMPSSPDSSSDSSTSSPQHPYDGPNLEAENSLPGVLMSQRPHCAQFFFQLADLGCKLQYPPLRDGARMLLKLIPPDIYTVECLQSLFQNHARASTNGAAVIEQGSQNMSPVSSTSVESLFFGTSPSQVLYHLEVMYALLMPALDPLSDKAFEFQYNFFKSGDAQVILDMLTKNNFLPNADVATKRSAYLTVLKMCKLLLTVIGHVMARVVDDPQPSPPQQNECGGPDGNGLGNLGLFSSSNTSTPTINSPRSPVAVLRQALHSIPNQNTEYMLRSVASKLAQNLAEQLVLTGNEVDRSRPMFVQALAWELPNITTVRAIIRLAWAVSSGNLQLLNATPDELHRMHDKMATKMPDGEDVLVCKEALEVLTVALVLNPKTLESLTKDKMWHTFIIDLLLLCKNRSVRVAAAEQFLLISTWCVASQQPLQFCITLLFTVLNTTVMENARNSHEYFQLLCRLLNYAFMSNCPLPTAETLLNNEIAWLKKIRENVKETGDSQVDEAVLEGHLGIAKELLSFMSPEKKYELGSEEKKGINLIKELVEDFIFPASRLMLHLQRTGELCADQAVPVCNTPLTTNAAFDFLVGLCVSCVPNMKLLVHMLTDMFYSERDEPLVEWDYLPPVGPRPLKGFVGLKNAGATCYMNSVLQQLYMVESIRVGILASEGAATDLSEDFSGEERMEGEGNMESNENDCNDEKCGLEESRKEYNIGILKQVQAIFGHLAYSKLQYYVPRGLWKHFKLQGEPVNLREQQDAVEFFMSLVESIDEALKALNQEQIMGKILGGSYSDQKICKGCPHRYSKEEPFSVISVDIRNHSTLLDSLEQYVKGELLEGADAYHCEKCNKKVVTVKRLCVKKLPPILAIQLKRFEYDFERVCAIKFNDYFEFPRDLDMDPYTVSGLAKLEGEMIDCDYDEISKEICTKYQLTGIVVHSGQASGGHYYSYILHRHSDGSSKWYKFDDGEVSECKMEDEEEMKTQCFGGDYMGEVFDHMLKRMSYRRQKRWWNAYMLFYTRLDVEENALMKSLNEVSLSDTKLGIMKMPLAIERSVRKQNIKFMHNRNQFSAEYFQFIRKLVSCNSPPVNRPHSNEKLTPEFEELAMLSVQLASRFLFHTGFHTKKTLRGTATEWYDVLCHHLRSSRAVRAWFAHNVLFQHPHRFCEYLLSCPSTEVRSAFMKIIVFLAHFSLQDGPCITPMLDAPTILLDPHATLSDHLLHAVLLLLHKEVSDHGRHLPHYFSLFHMYASLGVPERTQLLKLNVPATFMLVALDEGPGPPIKYQYPELTKLHQVVSQLIRCCDVSSKTQSSQSQQGMLPLPNPYGDPAVPDFIMPIQPQAAEILFGRTSYIKKLIEDANLSEETVKLLQFCCWENPHFSRTVLSELLWQIAYAYCHELRHHMDLLLSMLLIEDSWQTHRIHNALKGVPEEREGLFDTIQRSKNHYQKRAYQCIKCMVTLFSKCRPANQMLHTNGEVKRKWTLAVEWLQDELERRPYAPSTQYSYNNWSPPAQSNESTNGYFLERSNSARKTLERACELCPEEEPEVEEMSEEGESPQPEEQPTPQQKVAPTFMAYPAHAAASTNTAVTQRILAKRMPASQSYITGVQEQPSPGPSGITSNHPQVGTGEDTEPTMITTAAMQDSINEGTLSNSGSSAVLQQSSEQPQCGETSHVPCSTVDTA
ncbi:probable ubiquitin carboxyl-terminal hydrolase FAF-X isoform X1 [Cryptotermes secundus]|nr:probable ubiquitin carboxyl-terminal hydrolase FAF-X isoform X1 [Cryptotermes secundus]XP_023706841.1 probable ubiquitin carboxyl-terminal hydrolase FAF-X isoform X1 [Cryptotermes secundus]XP_023706842.1 probable ubiquitin carboxyl-terminal hydrolase FAF-X isoform X1 [Cryptotermes secundus]XP_033607212.1 probable ubiquitin carboxyl-terminal hydrolase FAF-X isoform X1 [Cryptotermes secundus]